MVQITVREWQIAGAATGVALAAGAAWWYTHRKRPTPDEIERDRRAMLLSFGRIVDGMLLDGFQITNEEGVTKDMLLYGYEIAGVVYECSQDITALREHLDPNKIKLGFPCTIRYQPGSPENSILVAESWSGLRDGLPVMWPVATFNTDSKGSHRAHHSEPESYPEPMPDPEPYRDADRSGFSESGLAHTSIPQPGY